MSQDSTELDVWGLVLAGGVGRRLWPRSQPHKPKQCHSFDGGPSLLERAVARTGVPPARVVVVTGAAMVDEVRALLPQVPQDQILIERRAANTAPAICWGSQLIQERGGRRCVVLPADQLIADEPAFAQARTAALAQANDGRSLVLLGQPATHPETGFGWIVPGPLPAGGGLRPVLRFVEKPGRSEAEALLAAGALWNGGIFVWSIQAIEGALRAQLPGMWEQLARDGDYQGQAISVDHGVLEHAEGLCVIPCEMGWSDLGSWRAVGAQLPAHSLGRARVAGGCAVDGGGHIVDAPEHTVVTLGVRDLLIVVSGNVLMICDKHQAQRVAELSLLDLDQG